MIRAADHDFRPDAKLTPFGILLPQYGELYLYFTASQLTSDFIVDCLTNCWVILQERFPKAKTLVLNQDNGPENHSRRTQFMKRITDFVDTFQIAVDLAYYPPYRSKYNPIERAWSVLEQHWNGSLLDSCAAALLFAQTMTFRGQRPPVQFVHTLYHTGIRLTQTEMAHLEQRFHRLPSLPKRFVRIVPLPAQ